MNKASHRRLEHIKACSEMYVEALQNTLGVISGKWKLPIVGSLVYGSKRFGELEKAIPNITARMLSKELKELEHRGMVERIVYDTTPVSVEYRLTKSGKSFSQVMDTMVEWGLQHKHCIHASSE